jgi:protein-S-isoprenylcysteine O-methyltransferase Ste14
MQPAAPVIATLPKRARHHWSDWAGCVFHSALAFALLWRSPRFGVLLLPTLLYDLALAASFLTRRPLRRQFASWPARAAAYSGTVLLPAFAWISATWFPSWTAPTHRPALIAPGVLLWALAMFAGLATVVYMRHSFSLLPQARQLVTAGPYRWARHPIYACYAVQYFGIWLTRPTPPLAAALVAWLLVTMARIRYEEQVLRGAFPEYQDYSRRVPSLGLRWRTPRRRASVAARGQRAAA